GSAVRCLQLATGSRDVLPEARYVGWTPADNAPGSGPAVWRTLPPQNEPGSTGLDRGRPRLLFDTHAGTLALFNTQPAWKSFGPRADGRHLLRGAELLDAVCQGDTLAALFRHPPDSVCKLRLFRGPEGIPLAEFYQPPSLRRFALSSDG